MRAAAELSSAAFAEAFLADFSKTKWFMVSRGVSPDTAEDIAQAAWARGWEQRHQLREVKAVLTWINVIALNLLRAASRRGRRMTDLAEAPECSYELNVTALEANRVLERCRNVDRDLLRRHYVEGHTLEEIAEGAGMNPSSVRVRLLRARRAARRMLKVGGEPAARASVAHGDLGHKLVFEFVGDADRDGVLARR